MVNVNEQSQIHLEIPSQFGCEKMAMKLAVAIAAQMGFPTEQVEDLETAVAEACLNAIEHGNQKNPQARVQVVLHVAPDRLTIDVHDEGLGAPPPEQVPEPDMARKMAGLEETRRLGLYLIKHLVDESGFVPPETQDGNLFRMVIHLPRQSE